MKRAHKTIIAVAVSASTVAAAGFAPKEAFTQIMHKAPLIAANDYDAAANVASDVSDWQAAILAQADEKVVPIQVAAKADTKTDQPSPKVKTKTKSKSKSIEYTEAWLMDQPAPKGGAEWKCMAEAIYYEARGESIKGQFAVAEVIMNRSESGVYPNSICGVIKQKAGNVCQFSYRCEGRKLNMPDKRSRQIAERIAATMLADAPRDLTKGATHYHTRAVNPSWSKKIPRTAAIGEHLFYREQRG